MKHYSYTSLLKLFPALLLCLLARQLAKAQNFEMGNPAYSSLKWDHIHIEGPQGLDAQNTIGLTTGGKVYT